MFVRRDQPEVISTKSPASRVLVAVAIAGFALDSAVIVLPAAYDDAIATIAPLGREIAMIVPFDRFRPI